MSFCLPRRMKTWRAGTTEESAFRQRSELVHFRV